MPRESALPLDSKNRKVLNVVIAGKFSSLPTGNEFVLKLIEVTGGEPCTITEASCNLYINDEPHIVNISTTLDTEEYSRLRSFHYTGASTVIILCDSSKPESLFQVREVYYPETMFYCPNSKKILVDINSSPTSTKLIPAASVVQMANEREIPCMTASVTNIESILKVADTVIRLTLGANSRDVFITNDKSINNAVFTFAQLYSFTKARDNYLSLLPVPGPRDMFLNILQMNQASRAGTAPWKKAAPVSDAQIQNRGLFVTKSVSVTATPVTDPQSEKGCSLM